MLARGNHRKYTSTTNSSGSLLFCQCGLQLPYPVNQKHTSQSELFPIEQSFFTLPNSVVTLGVLTVRVKDGCLIGAACRGIWLIRCYYSTLIHLEIFEVHFNCAGSQNLVGGGDCSLVVVAPAHFGTW